MERSLIIFAQEAGAANPRSPVFWRLGLGLCGPLLLLIGLAGCGGKPAPPILETRFDLSAEWPWADVLTETGAFDFGPDGRRYLGRGWYRSETSVPDPMVWAGGPESEISLPVVEARDLVLRLDLRAFYYDQAPAQSVTVICGGRVLAQAQLEPGTRQVIEVPWPADAVTVGQNLLQLKWGWSQVPREVMDSRDTRSLAAALHGLWLASAGAREPVEVAQAQAEDQRIWLPANTRADFFLDLPAGSTWRGRAEARGEAQLTLEVTDQAGHSRRLQADLEAVDEHELDLGPETGIRRLRFWVLGPAGSGIMLRQPRIEAPVTVEAAEQDRDEEIRPADRKQPVDGEPQVAIEKRDLVLYSIDTLRADRLGFHGGPVETPNFDALAAESLVFERLQAQSPWTKASMASIFTGLWPPEHGAFNRRHALLPQRLTLAELLNALGWQTAAIVTNPNITQGFGFGQGFEHFDYLGEKVPSGQVVATVERFLERRDDPRPLFLWIHVLDPHSPYDPPDDFRRSRLPEVSDEVADGSLELVNAIRAGRQAADPELMADLWSLYNTEVSYADQSFGDLRQLLAGHGLGDAVWTLISDHGEEFLEHGNLEHGRALHAESIDVPWTLSVPGVEPARVAEPAQHMDVLPTLLSALGVPIPKNLEGHAWIDTGGELRRPDSERLIFSHLHLDGAERVSVIDSRFKLMVEMSGDSPVKPRLYDLNTDRGETVDVWAEHPIHGGWLLSQIKRRRAAVGSTQAAEVEIDEETRKSLEALGYL